MNKFALITIILFIISIFIISLLIYLNLYRNRNIISEKVNISPSSTFSRDFNITNHDSLLVNVRPDSGECLCTLYYKSDEGDNTIIQSKWISDNQASATNIFLNKSLASNYRLSISEATTATQALVVVKETDSDDVINPYSAIVSPLNAKNTRVIEIVPTGSIYSENQSSGTVDAGVLNSEQVEIIARVSNSTSPKMNLFGSFDTDADTFVRINEFEFTDGTFDSVNDTFYLNEIALTSMRYFYIQIVSAAATDFKCTLVIR